MLLVQSVVNGFGSSVVAGYAAGTRIESICIVPMISTGNAMSTFTAQNMGAGQIDRVKKGFRQGTVMVLIFSMCLLPIAYVFGEQIVGIFVKDP